MLMNVDDGARVDGKTSFFSDLKLNPFCLVLLRPHWVFWTCAGGL